MFINTVSILGAAIALQLPVAQELEQLFWDCDYAATVTMLDDQDGAMCAMTLDKLKTEKFGGSFTQFLEWWTANKEAQYAKRK